MVFEDKNSQQRNVTCCNVMMQVWLRSTLFCYSYTLLGRQVYVHVYKVGVGVWGVSALVPLFFVANNEAGQLSQKREVMN